MNLEFSVLWFDDNEEYFASLAIDDIEDEIASWGFVPSIEKVSTAKEFSNHAPFQKFDLIVVDYNLGKYEYGQDFIEEIRGHYVYTEVIFYSTEEIDKLWSAIYEKHLEGVFVSSRNNVISKIISVGEHSVRKVLDLENMRGIVMAEVGELDHLLDRILTLGISGLSDDQQNTIFRRFHKGATKQNQDFGERLSTFSKVPDVKEMLELSDSNKRWLNFKRLWSRHDKLNGNDEIGEFNIEVLAPRNFLAHGRPEDKNDGSYLFHHQGKEFLFNDEVSSQLRQKILRYKTAFSEILEILEK